MNLLAKLLERIRFKINAFKLNLAISHIERVGLSAVRLTCVAGTNYIVRRDGSCLALVDPSKTKRRKK